MQDGAKGEKEWRAGAVQGGGSLWEKENKGIFSSPFCKCRDIYTINLRPRPGWHILTAAPDTPLHVPYILKAPTLYSGISLNRYTVDSLFVQVTAQEIRMEERKNKKTREIDWKQQITKYSVPSKPPWYTHQPLCLCLVQTYNLVYGECVSLLYVEKKNKCVNPRAVITI